MDILLSKEKKSWGINHKVILLKSRRKTVQDQMATNKGDLWLLTMQTLLWRWRIFLWNEICLTCIGQRWWWWRWRSAGVEDCNEEIGCIEQGCSIRCSYQVTPGLSVSYREGWAPNVGNIDRFHADQGLFFHQNIWIFNQKDVDSWPKKGHQNGRHQVATHESFYLPYMINTILTLVFSRALLHCDCGGLPEDYHLEASSGCA